MPNTLRLTFEYRDGQYVSLAPQKLEMVTPAQDLTPRERSAGGRFVELRSAVGETIMSAPLPGGMRPTVEFPTGDPDQPFGHTDPPPGSIVSVLMPADDRATEAALVEVSATSDRGLRQINKRDLATVSLIEGLEP